MNATCCTHCGLPVYDDAGTLFDLAGYVHDALACPDRAAWIDWKDAA
jgi:hypothetical protein